MSEIIVRRCYVSGRVQGVFFRGSTRLRAGELGVRGYARNLADGRVEVLAVGEQNAVQLLIDWLWRGPPSAQVRDVEVIELSLQDIADPPTGFVG